MPNNSLAVGATCSHNMLEHLLLDQQIVVKKEEQREGEGEVERKSQKEQEAEDAQILKGIHAMAVVAVAITTANYEGPEDYMSKHVFIIFF